MDALHALPTVQELDTRADQLRHRRAALPERAAKQQVSQLLASLRSRAGELQAQRAVLAEEEDRLEEAVAAGERKRASLEVKAKSTFVPRDAQAIAHDLEGIASRQADLEDRILELMEQIEPLDGELASVAARDEAAATQLADIKAALLAAEQAVDAELAGVVADRAAAVADLPAPLVDRYEKLRVRLGGVAVARLEGTRCLGCHLELPRGELEEVRREPPDALPTCPQCTRLLVR
jgi:predicted  nucleic acid-binding Zn-ribbon protein